MFKANLVYIVSSRTARDTQRNPVSKKPKKKKRVALVIVSVQSNETLTKTTYNIC